MNNELALTANDFMRAGKINFDGFTNVHADKNFLTEQEFRANYGTGFNVLTKAQVDDLHKANDNLEKAEGAEPAKMQEAKRVVVSFNGGLSEVFVMSKPVAIKGELNKAQDIDIEKGLLDYNSKMEFKKTGKEIKDKLTVLKATYAAQITAMSTSAAEILQMTEEKPTRIMSDWEYGDYKGKIGDYALFDYDMCYFRTDDQYNGSMNGSKTKESCDACSKYNDYVYNIVNLKRNICECDTFIDNLVDTEKYTLSTNELTKIGF